MVYLRSVAVALPLTLAAVAHGFAPMAPVTRQAAVARGGSFGQQSQTARPSTAIRMADVAPITVTGNNIDVTDPLKDYVNKKLERTLSKLGGDVVSADVHLIVNKNPRVAEKHEAEVVVFAKGHVIRAKEKSEGMYASIDLVTDRITRKLRQYKERKTDKRRNRPGLSETTEEVAAQVTAEALEEDGDDGEFVDEYADFDPNQQVDMSVVKRKEFPMPPQTVADAVLCLDYIDHDFYCFRNADTEEVNVVYKRNSGGVGLIQPEL